MTTLDRGNFPTEPVTERLTTIVSAWDGVSVSVHRFGGVEFRVDRREIGHVHPGGIVDVPFPMRLRRALVSAGRAEAHHTLPHSGWVSMRLRTEHDIPGVVELFRLNYDRLRGSSSRPGMFPIIGKATMLGDRVADDMPA